MSGRENLAPQLDSEVVGDARRFRFLVADHADRVVRQRINAIVDGLTERSLASNRLTIDATMREFGYLGAQHGDSEARDAGPSGPVVEASSGLEARVLEAGAKVMEGGDPPQVTLIDGSPVPEDGSHTELKPNGQQVGYVVLSEAERAKGFVRPVRRTYTHVGIRPYYPLRNLTDEELDLYRGLGYICYEEYPLDSGKLGLGKFWTEKELRSGCGTDTTMNLALAETYARDPHFYGGTFCCRCGKHFNVNQFVWKGTDERVGS